MRDAAAAAGNAASSAGSAAGAYQSTAGNIAANLVPTLTRQMTNPQGMSQRDVQSQITQKMAGEGGSTAGLYGAAGANSMQTRNPMGFSAALDAASRTAAKGVASTGENVAATNAQTKLQQQQQAESSLGSLYSAASSAGVGEGNVQSSDIKDEIEANQGGWLQNLTGLANAGANVYKAYKS